MTGGGGVDPCRNRKSIQASIASSRHSCTAAGDQHRSCVHQSQVVSKGHDADGRAACCASAHASTASADIDPSRYYAYLLCGGVLCTHARRTLNERHIAGVDLRRRRRGAQPCTRCRGRLRRGRGRSSWRRGGSRWGWSGTGSGEVREKVVDSRRRLLAWPPAQEGARAAAKTGRMSAPARPSAPQWALESEGAEALQRWLAN